MMNDRAGPSRQNLAPEQGQEAPRIPLPRSGPARNAVGVLNADLQVAGGANPVNLSWQSTKSTVKERIGFLFNNELMSDITFNVGTEPSTRQRIPAHKFVLSAGSAVFDRMFNGPMSADVSEIELSDIEPQAFLALLRFLYSDEVRIGPDTVIAALYTAKKYEVLPLEHHCVAYLKVNLTVGNAFTLLTQARFFDEKQLEELCWNIIDKCTPEAVDSEAFLDITHELLSVLLGRNTLRVLELKLFQAVKRWAEVDCERKGIEPLPQNVRTVLGPSLMLIRFPQMSLDEFAHHVAQSGILLDKEVVSMFLYYSVNPKPDVPFPDGPRCVITARILVANRFGLVESRWGYSGTSDRIKFATDKRIFVSGYGLYGSIHGKAEYEANMALITAASGQVVAQNDTTFTCDGSHNTFRVYFKEAVEVKAKCQYVAAVTLKGPDSFYGTKGQRKVTIECPGLPGLEKVTFQFYYVSGNNNGTSIEDGQIAEILFHY